MGKKRIYKESRRISRRVSTLHGGGSNHDAKQDSQLPSYFYRMRVRRIGRRAQHKQSHVLELLDAGQYTGNIVALPNNRVRVTHPAWFETGQGAPDFRPNQHIFNSKENVDYVWDTQRVFNNLYSEDNHNEEES